MSCREEAAHDAGNFSDMLVSDLTVLLSDCLLPTKDRRKTSAQGLTSTIFLFRQMDDEDEDADAEDGLHCSLSSSATGGTPLMTGATCTMWVSPSSSVPYDDTPDRQGTSDVLGVIERIYHRFCTLSRPRQFPRRGADQLGAAG